MPNDPAPSTIALDAVEVARQLRRSPDADMAARVLALAAPHMRPPPAMESGTIRTIAALAPDDARATLVRMVAPAIDLVFLPALRDRTKAAIAGVDGGVEGGPAAPSCAEAFATLRDLSPSPARRQPILAMQKDITGAVQARAKSCTEVLAEVLQGDDFPDIAALSNDLMRLEALRWIVEILGDARAVEEIAYLSRRLARVTLTRAAGTVERFLADRAMLNLFDNAAVISQVDNLIVVAARVLDARADGEEERTAFVETADQQALLDFLATLAKLSDALTTLLVKAARQPGGDVFFTSLVRQTECLYRFSRFIDHDQRPAQLQSIEAGLHRRLKALAGIVMDMLDAAVENEGGNAKSALTRAEELGAAFVRAGLEEEARTVLLRARVARKALGSTAS